MRRFENVAHDLSGGSPPREKARTASPPIGWWPVVAVGIVAAGCALPPEPELLTAPDTGLPDVSNPWDGGDDRITRSVVDGSAGSDATGAGGSGAVDSGGTGAAAGTAGTGGVSGSAGTGGSGGTAGTGGAGGSGGSSGGGQGGTLPGDASTGDVGVCPGTMPDDCSGVCVNLNSDPQNCGACGNICNFPNADVTCVNRTCTMTGCKTGYGDCTSAPGCETQLNSLMHCGKCNTPCGAPGDVASCATGTCVVGCHPQAESCFNNLDDDCDGFTDCADSDCAAVAVCEPVGSFTYGTMSTTGTPCPIGFTAGSTSLYGGLSAPTSCVGLCSCAPTTTTCDSLTVDFYATASSCQSGVWDWSSSFPLMTDVCHPMPNLDAWDGYSASATANQSCTTSGSPTVPTSSWMTSTLFCQANPSSAGGCTSGATCVPKPAGEACLLADGSATCPSGFATQTLYTQASDTRSCSCACTASGGSCNDMTIDVSATCNAGTSVTTLGSGPHCGLNSTAGAYALVVRGGARAPTACSASAVMQGSLTPAGPKTVCCQ